MDIKRQERGGACALGAEFGLVHSEPRHSERGLLPPHRPSLHPRFRTDRHKRAGFLFRRKTARSEHHSDNRGRHAGLRDSEYLHGGRYRINKTVLADLRRDVILQHVRFHALLGQLPDYRIYALLAPHLVNRGARNTAWIGDYKGVPMLFAEGMGSALALGCSASFLARSAGFVGMSDGWQDLAQHFALHWRYDNAQDGNVALTGEIDLSACGGEFVLALGFGRHPEEAALRVRASLCDDLDEAIREYVTGWQEWQDRLLPLDRKRNDDAATRIAPAPPSFERTKPVRSRGATSLASLFLGVSQKVTKISAVITSYGRVISLRLRVGS